MRNIHLFSALFIYSLLWAPMPAGAAPTLQIGRPTPIDEDSIVSRNGRYVLTGPYAPQKEVLYKDGREILRLDRRFGDLSGADTRNLFVSNNGLIARAIVSPDYSTLRLVVIDSKNSRISADSELKPPGGMAWKAILLDLQIFRPTDDLAAIGVALAAAGEYSSMLGFEVAWIDVSSISAATLTQQNPADAPDFSAALLDPWFFAADPSGAVIVRDNKNSKFWKVDRNLAVTPYTVPAEIGGDPDLMFVQGADEGLYAVGQRVLAENGADGWQVLFTAKRGISLRDYFVDVTRGMVLEEAEIVSRRGVIGSHFACRFPNSTKLGSARFQEIQPLQFNPAGTVFARFLLKLNGARYSGGVLPLQALTSRQNYCATGASATLGGECAAIDQAYQDGKTWNNYYNNSKCEVQGVARDAAGARMSGADAVVLFNGQVISRTKSDANGRFKFRGFRVTDPYGGNRLVVIVPYNHPSIRGAEIVLHTADHAV